MATRVYVPLTQGKRALINARFAGAVLAFNWYAQLEHGIWYATRKQLQQERQEGKRKAVKLHRFIYTLAYGPIPPGMMIDHIDGNGLNNKLSNLRLATRSQNATNTAAHRKGRLPGTTRSGARWAAQIHVNNKRVWLGRFNTEEEAHAAYLQALAASSSYAARILFAEARGW